MVSKRYNLMTTQTTLLVLSFALFGTSLALAQVDVQKASELSLYEFGVMSGGGLLPDYPAAGRSHGKYIIVPTAKYRGESFRVGDGSGGLSFRLLRDTKVRMSVSVSGSFPSSSADNPDRIGMPDLDWIGEFGPKIFVNLTEIESRHQIAIQLPVRYVISTDFKSAAFRGMMVAPSITYGVRNFLFEKLSFWSELEFDWVSEGVASYFYHVSPGLALPTRPSYQASGGYLGTSATSGLAYRPGSFQFFGLVSLDVYSGAPNQSSPLFKNTTSLTFFAGIGFWFSRSEEKGYL
jgi:MipA family protein